MKIVHLLLISAGISLAIGVLGNIAIWAIGKLFDFSDYGMQYGKIHAIWSLFSASIFCPFYILANFPILSDKNDNFTLGKTANFLIKYIEIPIIAIYFVILYAYSVKVLLNFWDWPKGIISYLVILFSFFGYFVFTNAKHFVEQSSLARIFVKYFPYAVLFQLPMLFYAIYLRINQYGLTTNRYIIIILGIILLAISLYFIFSRKKNIVVIPFLISFVAIFISIGPWGIFALPQHLQFENFKKNIEILGLFKDGKFTKFDENIHDINVKNKIIGQLEYLCNYKNKCQKLKPYFGDAIPEKSPYYDSNSLFKDIDNDEEWGKINHWEIQRFLEDEMNLSKNYLINEKDEYRRINIMGKKSSESLVDIRGYDYQMPLGYARMDEIMMKEALWKGKIDGNSLGEFALKEFLQNILKKIEVTKNRTEYFVDEISFTTENDDFAIKMIPNYLPIDYKSDDDFYFGSTHLEGILLIKDKKGILENALQK